MMKLFFDMFRIDICKRDTIIDYGLKGRVALITGVKGIDYNQEKTDKEIQCCPRRCRRRAYEIFTYWRPSFWKDAP